MVEINGISSKRGSKICIGYLPQFFGLYKELTVKDCMRLFCSIKNVKHSKEKDIIENCLEAVNMSQYQSLSGAKLSGGMVRRIGIAQALINKPELVLFDEPTAGLDPEERMNFKKVVSHLGREETVLISTHIVEDIEACCDHVIIMNHGKICCILTCEELVHIADGKVYACKKEDEPKIKGDYFIEKQYEEQDEICYRILTNEHCDVLTPLSPTLEDGYMCVIKQV